MPISILNHSANILYVNIVVSFVIIIPKYKNSIMVIVICN